MGTLKQAMAGLVGGFVGGALVGLAESLVIAFGATAEEYWVFVFAACSYGVVGAMLGCGWGAFVGLPMVPRVLGRNVTATAAGLVVAALGAVVTRFRVVRDLFGESLPLASASGLIVHGTLLLGALLLFVFLRRLLTAAGLKRGETRAGLIWAAGSLAVGLAMALLANATVGGSDEGVEKWTGSASGPNVVLVVADTLRADHIGPYGSDTVDTPALDALAADAVVFEHAIAQSSWTRPSIATILTSLYPASHQVMLKTDFLPDGVVTIAETMRDNGYLTAGFVTNINVAPSFNFHQGFEAYSYLAPDFFFGATDSGSKLSLYNGMRLVRERFLSRDKYVYHYYQDAETVNSAVLPWLGENKDQPFFVLVHYMDPHDPYFELPYNGTAVARVETPHPDPGNTFRLHELYNSNVEYLDRFLGALFDDLRRNGVYENSVIAFTADHGEEFYEHGGWWHGTTLYEEQIRVPLIIKLPGRRGGGSRSAELARLLDVAPTLAAAAGITAPVSWQGRDLFGSVTAPELVYLQEDHEGNVLEAVRGARWKLVTANDGNPRGLQPLELYDLRRDPGERENLASTEADRVERLLGDLAALRRASGASAVSGERGEIDEASKERLRALGYIQ
ncbi:MAG: sulfatase [Candidatus Binatia bacterium]